jgi:hypothetical protein
MQPVSTPPVSILFEKSTQIPEQGPFREQSLSDYTPKDLQVLIENTDPKNVQLLTLLCSAKLSKKQGEKVAQPSDFVRFALEEFRKNPDIDLVKLSDAWTWAIVDGTAKPKEEGKILNLDS